MPPRVPKSVYDQFVTKWSTGKQWAESQGIPYSDFYATYQNDWNRLLSGTSHPFSYDEMYQSLAALYKYDPTGTGKNTTGQLTSPVSFTTPSSQPAQINNGPFGWLHALGNDVGSIAAGISHLPGTLFDWAKQDIEHPSNLLKGSVLGDLLGITTKATPQPATEGYIGQVFAAARDYYNQVPGAPMLPGLMDVVNLSTPAGRKWMAQHPLSDLLDLGGLGKLVEAGSMATRAAGLTSVADMIGKFPDHPFLTTLKAAYSMSTKLPGGFGGQITDFGKFVSDTLDAHGLSEPSRKLMNYPVNLLRARFHRLTGETIMDPLALMVKEFRKAGGRRDDLATANFLLSRAHQAGIPLDKLIQDNRVPAHIKTYIEEVKAFQKGKTAKELVDIQDALAGKDIPLKSLTEVTNPFTGEKSDPVPITGPLVRGFRAMNVRLGKQAQAKTDLQEALDTPRNALKNLQDHTNQLRALQQEIVTKRGDFRFKDPARQRTSTFNAYHKRFTELFETGGKLNQLADAIQSANWTRAKILLRGIRTALRHKQGLIDWASHAEIQKLLATLDQASEDITKYHATLSPNYTTKVAKAKQTVIAETKRVDDGKPAFDKLFRDSFIPRYEWLIRDRLPSKIQDWVLNHQRAFQRLMDSPQSMEDFFSKIMQVDSKGNPNPDYIAAGIKQVLLPHEVHAIIKSAIEEIDQFRAMGLEPVFLPRVHPSEVRGLEHPSLGRLESTYRSSLYFERHVFPDSSVYDSMAGMAKLAIDQLRRDTRYDLVMNHFMKLTLSKAQVLDAISHEATLPDRTQLQELGDFQRYGFSKFNPDEFMTPKTRDSALTGRDDIYIPTPYLQLIRKLDNSMNKSFGGAFDKSMQAYRISILGLSPRFGAHIIFGGGFFLMAELGPAQILRWAKPAFNMIRGGSLTDMVSHGVAEANAEGNIFSGFPVYHFLSMSTMGRLVREENFANKVSDAAQKTGEAIAKHNPVNWYQEKLHVVSNFYRAIGYLSAEDRHAKGLIPERDRLNATDLKQAKNWGVTESQWYGVKIANRFLANTLEMSPLERSVIRYVMPFYGWTRHVIRYVLRFPYDHPLRTSTLTAIANVSTMDDPTGIPLYMYRLFFMGQPDKFGNVGVIDTRQWNPIRDVSNYMSLSGYISGLNPFLSSILRTAGVNTLSASPELYPSLTYNAFYGTMEGSSGVSLPNALVQDMFPQVNTLQSYLSSTSYLRHLFKTNPARAEQQLFAGLGIPWVPYSVNLKQEQIRSQIDQYDMAKSAVNAALMANNMVFLNGYSGALPFSGANLPKSYFASLINEANQLAQRTGVDIPAAELVASPYPPQPTLAELLSGQPS